LHRFAGHECRTRIAAHDFADFENVPACRDVECLTCVLLDEQDGRTARVDFRDDAKDRLDEQR
jgi:hypothetical protein